MSAPTIDIEVLLKPIPGSTPSGRDIRDEKSYEILKEARREEDGLNQGDWKHDPKVADWPKVVQTASKILAQESKDLQVAAWLLEGLVKRHGFAGLRDGLKILRELHERFWDSLYPSMDDGDLDYRSGRIDALNKILPFAIKSTAVTHPPGGPLYSYAQYVESQEVENLRRGAASDAEKKRQLAEALAEGKLEGDKFEKAVAGTPLTHCVALLESITQSADEFDQLDRVLSERYGADVPSLRLVKEAISECRSLMESIVKKKGGAVERAMPDPVNTEATMGSPAVRPHLSTGVEPRDRSDALFRLAAIAEFFRRTEPHSPVSYLVQRAARWGEMPLAEWLQEVIKNQDVLGDVRETLGMKDQETGGEG
jgi:type VI secretion system protein ImpA